MSGAATTHADDRSGRIGAGIRRFVAVPLRRQTYLNLAYLVLAFPLGLAYFVVVTIGVSVGIGFSLSIVGLPIGIPILLLTVGITLAVAGFERWLTAALLDLEIEPGTELDGKRHRDLLVSLLTEPKTWSSLIYVPVKFVLGVVSLVLVTTGLSTAVSMVMLPFYYDRPGLYVGVVSDRAPEIHQTLYLGWNYLLVGVEAVFTLGYWRISTLPEALLAAVLGVALLFATLHALNGLARVWGWFARTTLEDGYDPLAVVARSLSE
ncbi:sensor domain-containing protein [Natrarchaeobius chitinivorans]|uniref:Histidine kinase n=1 Tax=Natrarchaeobius chitinivorans TaxID=1679083 RepID=A0A3N6M9Y1_NATCH|nr:sensor domain-containing protein [Natrarchaeobius chitinivorans]RQG92211.1 histidine kinase [Natrarchaeobius chitinivorans]